MAVLVVVAFGAASVSCSGGDAPGKAVATTRPLPAGTVRVVEGRDAKSVIAGVATVEVPGSSISGSGTLRMARASKVAVPGPEFVDPGGTAVKIDLEGAKLSGPARLSLVVGAAPEMPPGIDVAPVALTYDEKAATWVEQPSRYDRASGRLVVETSHFSSWSWAWPTKSLPERVLALIQGLTGTTPDQPQCQAEDEARSEGWSVTSDDGDRIMWCFGIEGGRRVLRLADNRPYPVVLTYDGDAFALDKGPEGDVSVYSLYRVLLEAAGRDSSAPQIALPPGATATLRSAESVPAEGTWTAKTEWDGLAAFAEGVDVLWQTVLMMIGGSAAPGAAERFVEAVTQSDCVRKWIVGDGGLNKAKSVTDSLDALYGFVRECSPGLLEIAAKAAGQGNPAFAIVSWFANTVVSAIRQAIGGIYATSDIITGNGPSAAYKVITRRANPATVAVDECPALDAVLADEQIPAGGHTFCTDSWGVIVGFYATNYGISLQERKGGSWSERAAFNGGEEYLEAELRSVGAPDAVASALCKAVSSEVFVPSGLDGLAGCGVEASEDPKCIGGPPVPERFEVAALCLYDAWKRGDRIGAAKFADPPAVRSLFDLTWEPGWEFDGCHIPGTNPDHPMGECVFHLPAQPGDMEGAFLTFIPIFYGDDEEQVIGSVEFSG